MDITAYVEDADNEYWQSENQEKPVEEPEDLEEYTEDSINGLDNECINEEDLSGVECDCKIIAINECYVSGYDNVYQFDAVTRCNEHLDEGNINRDEESIEEYDEENIQDANNKEYEEQDYLKQPEDENKSKCFEGV